MTALESCREQAEKLRERMRTYQEQLKEETDPQRRAALKSKVSVYRTALRDVQVQLDYLDPPKERKARKEQRRRLDIGALSWDWFERSGAVWSDIEGQSWQQTEAGDFVETGVPMEQLQSWLAQAALLLTDRQRLYIDAYYNQGLSLERIAQEHGVTVSTVSRVIRAGLARMGDWVEAKKLLAACAGRQGRFDWTRYLTEGKVLTPRQRQLALLVLSGLPRSQRELAGKLELEQSTVSRTLAAAGRTLQRLETPRAQPVSRPDIRNWEQAGPRELAQQTGMGLGDYYRLCRERVGSITRYRWELYQRMRMGQDVQETAQELDLNPRIVRSNWSKLRTMERRGQIHADP